MKFYEVFNKRQSETEAAFRACARVVGLPEPFEDVREHACRDAYTVVADDELNLPLQTMRR